MEKTITEKLPAEPDDHKLLVTIFEYISRISKEQNRDHLILLLADMGRDIISADRSSIWLFDSDKRILWIKVAHGVNRIEIPCDHGFVGWVFKHGESVVTNDPYDDPRFDKNVDKQTGYRTRNIISIPIRDSLGEIFGVYQCVNKISEKRIFDEIDKEHLQLAASYTGKQLESFFLQEEIENTQKEIIFTLAETGEMRSKETGNHVRRVSEYSRLLAELAGISEAETKVLKTASPLHDIGKIAIPDSILLKPGLLTDAEREKMKEHTNLGYEMLRHSERRILKAAAAIALGHHEKWDGSGYPQQLKGEEIPIFARITAITDVFDALACERVYKKAWPLEKIKTLYKEEQGKHFDPVLIDLFFKHFDKFVEIRDKLKD